MTSILAALVLKPRLLPTAVSVVPLALALATLAMVSPAASAPKCPATGQPYNVAGIVKKTDTTNDGRTFYSILPSRHSGCGSSEDDTIAVYPDAPVVSCSAGAHAKARGSYSFQCTEDPVFGGAVCVAHLNNATLVCK
jgi:hypothetical protein